MIATDANESAISTQSTHSAWKMGRPSSTLTRFDDSCGMDFLDPKLGHAPLLFHRCFVALLSVTNQRWTASGLGPRMTGVMDPHGARVLLVEDDEELAGLISDYLSENGLRVTVVGDGAKVEMVLSASRPDLIILDQMLPNKDGLQLCR